ncbi:nectin-3 [Fundulus heteroclitus]|uniref:nectin-3 n=1 Tax=Fundulus heteroclitus TaxID=8078 RepID=UPI00165C20BE|nr:nectin-3 [Fundulus heteroclitus]
MTFLFVFFFLSVSAASSGLPERQAVTAKPEQNVSLGCLGPAGGAVQLLTWTKVGHDSDYVFFYRNDRPYEAQQHQAFRGRVLLRDAEALQAGDFSVVLQNVSAADAGTYKCRSIFRSPAGDVGEFQSSVNLTVSGNDEEELEESGDQLMTTGSDPFLFLLASLGVATVLLLLIMGCAMFWKSKSRSVSFQENKKRSDELI